MKKLLTDPLLHFLFYILMVPFTFGHAYTHFPPSYKSVFTDHDIEYSIGEKSVGSFFASVGWPFYWSVQIWK